MSKEEKQSASLIRMHAVKSTEARVSSTFRTFKRANRLLLDSSRRVTVCVAKKPQPGEKGGEEAVVFTSPVLEVGLEEGKGSSAKQPSQNINIIPVGRCVGGISLGLSW